MFDKKTFKKLLLKSMGELNATEYSKQSGVNRTYISKLLNEKMDNPPSPEILRGLASVAKNDVTYNDFMKAAGYIEEYSNITKETLKNKDFARRLPFILQAIDELMPETRILKTFQVLNDDEKVEIFNAIINKTRHNNTLDTRSQLEIIDLKDIDDTNKQNTKSNNKQDIYPEEFTDPVEARAYVNKHQIFGSGGFDADKLDDDEIVMFANELLQQMKMVSYKYKK